MSFFFKQWGGVHKTKAGRLLDGQTYDEIPDRGSRPRSITNAEKHCWPRRSSDGNGMTRLQLS